MIFQVTKGFHFAAELYVTGSQVNSDDLPEHAIEWLQNKGCLMPLHDEPVKRKTKPKKGVK